MPLANGTPGEPAQKRMQIRDADGKEAYQRHTHTVDRKKLGPT